MKMSFSIEGGREDNMKEEIEILLKSGDAFAFIHDWQEKIRAKVKWGSEEDQKTTWDEVRELWYSLKEEYDLKDLA